MEMIMMMDPAVKCLCLLAVVAVLFVTEKLPLAVTSVFAAIFCWLLGLVPIEQVFLGLADSTVVLFGGMFIVGAAMFYTGLAQDIGGQIVKLFGTGEIKLMVGIMVIAAGMSAFLSNTGTTACLIPVVIGICKEAHIPVSREMMPLAFAAGLGGTCTLIGTPPNIIANVALKAAGMGDLQFGFFEYAWIGVPITVAGILYMVFIGRHLLPKTDADDFNVDEVEQEIEANETSKTKKIICGIIMLGVIITMATGIVPLEIAAVIGALLCVITGCLSERQAYDSIDWVTIFLFRWYDSAGERYEYLRRGQTHCGIYSGGSRRKSVSLCHHRGALHPGRCPDAVHEQYRFQSTPLPCGHRFGGPGRRVPAGCSHGDSYRILLCFCKSCRYSAEYSRSRPGQVLLHGLCQVRHRSCCHLPRGIHCGNPRGMAFLPELRGVWQYD